MLGDQNPFASCWDGVDGGSANIVFVLVVLFVVVVDSDSPVVERCLVWSNRSWRELVVPHATTQWQVSCRRLDSRCVWMRMDACECCETNKWRE